MREAPEGSRVLVFFVICDARQVDLVVVVAGVRSQEALDRPDLNLAAARKLSRCPGSAVGGGGKSSWAPWANQNDAFRCFRGAARRPRIRGSADSESGRAHPPSEPLEAHRGSFGMQFSGWPNQWESGPVEKKRGSWLITRGLSNHFVIQVGISPLWGLVFGKTTLVASRCYFPQPWPKSSGVNLGHGRTHNSHNSSGDSPLVPCPNMFWWLT